MINYFSPKRRGFSIVIALLLAAQSYPLYAQSIEEAAKLLENNATINPQLLGPNVPEYVIIKPSEQVTFSSETTASILTVNVREGSTFHEGDILMLLDCRVQQADLTKAMAQQEAATAALESAQKLKSYGSISKFELTQASSQAAISNSEVAKLKAIVEKCSVVAPFDGAVADLLVHVHETVKPGDPLLKIVSTEKLDFELQVPSQWLTWLKLNSIFYVQVNEVNQSFKVKVSKINPQIDSISQTVRIVGNLIEPNKSLLPGMSGQATFPDNPESKTH